MAKKVKSSPGIISGKKKRVEQVTKSQSKEVLKLEDDLFNGAANPSDLIKEALGEIAGGESGRKKKIGEEESGGVKESEHDLTKKFDESHKSSEFPDWITPSREFLEQAGKELFNSTSIDNDKITKQDDIMDKTKEKETYFKLGEDPQKEGILEIDLVTFREKGEETRYIALKFSGVDERKEPPILQESFFNIETEEQFNALKTFMANLNWND